MSAADHPVDPDHEVIVAARSPRRGESVYHLRTDCGASHQLEVERRVPLRALNGRWRCCRYCHPDDDIRTEQARASLSRQPCPKCGEAYGQLPQHLAACDGGATDA